MGKHFRLCEDSYEATNDKGGYRHYKCTDEGSDEEYSYYTDPMVYKTNPKTGEPLTDIQAVNPYLPNFEMLPDNELHKFWSKKDREWRVYVTGSHDSYTNGIWCGNEVVCWSAPVYDLSDWRYEGVLKDTGWYFACDFAYDLMTDQAIFYAFPFFGNPEMEGHHLWVNGCSDPGAKFTEPFCPEGIEGIDYFPMSFDPAIHIDPNGDITVVFDIMDREAKTPKHCRISRLNEDRTGLKWSVPVQMAEGQHNTEGFNPKHYEANTIDYAEEFGAYIIQYSYVAEEGKGEGQGYYPLAYIYTFDHDLEHAKWIWGGIIGDNSGRYRKNPKTGLVEDCHDRTYSWDNNHGGLVKINGQWYISNHRHTGIHASRQGFLSKINMYMKDGKLMIDPVECTSSIDAPLHAYEEISAHLACYLTPAMNYSLKDENDQFMPPTCRITTFKSADEPNGGFVYDDPDYAKHRTPIIGIHDGVVIGYKYLAFGNGGKDKLGLSLLVNKDTSDIDGRVTIWIDAPTAEAGGQCIGQIAMSNAAVEEATVAAVDTAGVSWHRLCADMDRTVTGDHGVYFVFDAEEEGCIGKLDAFCFV